MAIYPSMSKYASRHEVVSDPPFTVERYGTFGSAVTAERDWLKAENSQLAAALALAAESECGYKDQISDLEFTRDSLMHSIDVLGHKLDRCREIMECNDPLNAKAIFGQPKEI